MKTLGYITGVREIKIGEEYYFGELWDGCGDGEELLESGSISVFDEEKFEQGNLAPNEDYLCWNNVEFEILKLNENLLDVRVKVKDIF